MYGAAIEEVKATRLQLNAVEAARDALQERNATYRDVLTAIADSVGEALT